MFVYWAIFAFFAAGTFLDAKYAPDLNQSRPIWLFGGLLIFIMIGFRYEVGADWKSYEFIFSAAGHYDFWRLIRMGDWGFQVLNWTVNQLDGEIVWVNVVCALIFTWGLFSLAKVQPFPWLAILVAVPYLVIVVSNYTRQAAALGLIMAGLASLARGGSLARFIVYVTFAAMFHRTAVAILPLVIFSRPTNRFLNITGGLAALYALYDVFLARLLDDFVSNYIKTGYSSQGAAIRIAIEVLAASLFLLRRKHFSFEKHEESLWTYFSFASFAALVALLVSPSSTAVDRLSLYLMPLQLVVLSRLPHAYISRTLGLILVAAYCFAVQFVWLNFATHAKYWVPYQFYPLFD